MKHRSLLALILTATIFPLVQPSASVAQSIKIWQTDVCEKIFVDSLPGEEKTIQMNCAANEYESALVGLHSDVDGGEIQISISDLQCDSANATIAADNLRAREIGTIHLEKNTDAWLTEDLVVRKAPCDIPDVLYEPAPVALKANESKGLWITLYVPKGTPSGEYLGSLSLKYGEELKTVPLALEVFPFELSDTRHFYMTNWWFPYFVASRHGTQELTEEYWEILENYFQNMRDHRQNVVLCDWRPGYMLKATRKADSSWSFDFSILDRFIDLALKYGVVERLELTHIGGLNRETRKIEYSRASVFDEAKNETVELDSEEWLAPVLHALCDHLRERGLFERAMIHLADEPYLPDMESWREGAQRLRAIEPELKIIDAVESVNFNGLLDVWVPKLTHFDRWRSAYEARRDQGEFWFYICNQPVGKAYPNRFMDLPAVRTRVIHWINYTENLVGYLHWGYNYWKEDPFGVPADNLPPGDTHIVYPGNKKPLDSIRWELQRESAEDFEYLKLLEEKLAAAKKEYDPDKAWFFEPNARPMEIARRVVPSLTETTLDYNVVNEARREIVNEIQNVDGPVRLIVRSFPEDRTTSHVGVVIYEFYGITTPGAKVTINGEEIPVSEDGFFGKAFWKWEGDHVFEFVATLGDDTAKTTRVFKALN